MRVSLLPAQVLFSRRVARRRGAVAPLVIAALPALLAAFLLALSITSLRHSHLELQIALNAAGLAGANALVPVDDTLLLGADPIPDANRDAIFANVRDVVVDYAMRNQFRTMGVTLDRNDANDPAGNVVIGTMDHSADINNFNTDLTAPWNLYAPQYNTVQVTSLQSAPAVGLQSGQVGILIKSFIDRDVVGFKVEGSSHILWPGAEPAIPALPLAIQAGGPGNWDDQIISRNGTDNWMIDPVTHLPIAGSDGIPEITVKITGDAADNGQVPIIGVATVQQVTGVTGDPNQLGQVRTGITASQLTNYNPITNYFTLFNGIDNQQNLTRFDVASFVGSDFDNLRDALNDIAGQRRIWLLYDNATAGLTSNVNVIGFVAARIMNVTSDSSSVTVVLQPTMLITTDSITDFTKRTLGPRTIFNPYVSRVRLAQ